jgi:hypothetical protein
MFADLCIFDVELNVTIEYWLSIQGSNSLPHKCL